jgi:ornithine decarboxylase
MKTMKIAVSRELISILSTHRQMVTLDSTDFTDVAAVVITLAESRSGILTLLKRTGFDVPVFLFDQTSDETPDGVTAVINGKEQDWLELEPPPVIMKIICCRRFSIRYASMSR